MPKQGCFHIPRYAIAQNRVRKSRTPFAKYSSRERRPGPHCALAGGPRSARRARADPPGLGGVGHRRGRPSGRPERGHRPGLGRAHSRRGGPDHHRGGSRPDSRGVPARRARLHRAGHGSLVPAGGVRPRRRGPRRRAPAARLAGDGHPAFGRGRPGRPDRGCAWRCPARSSEELRGPRRATPPRRWRTRSSPGPPASATWMCRRGGGVAEGGGADAPVLIVGGDDRLRRYRHPMAAGAPARELVMAVVVARRAGLHAAATRFACAGPCRRTCARCGPGCAGSSDGRAGREQAGRSYGQALSRARRGLRAGGRRGRLGGPLPGRPDRLRPARVRDRPVPARDSRWYAAPHRGRPRGRLESQPAGRREGRGHLPRAPGGMERAHHGRAGLAGGGR